MKIVVAGGSGFIGQKLTASLSAAGHRLVILSRHPEKAQQRLPVDVQCVAWGKSEDTAWEQHIAEAAAVVNLAGESLAGAPWTRSRKQRIIESRVRATRALVAAIGRATVKPGVLISASAVGYYGTHPNKKLGESSPPGDDFLSGVCLAWEQEAEKARDFGVRLVVVRTGFVLGADGGALPKMMLPFKFFVGGRLGSGRQWLSWIHIDDLIGVMAFALQNPAVDGPVNATAPQPITNSEFVKELGKALHRPAFLPAPAAAIRLVLGEQALLVLEGQRVLPEKALQLGYVFRFAKLADALHDLLAQ